jgi:hypothetical protein
MIWIVIALALLTLSFTIYTILYNRPEPVAHRRGTRLLIDCRCCGDLHMYTIFPGDTLAICRSCGANVFDPERLRMPATTVDAPSRHQVLVEESVAAREHAVWEEAA